MAKEPFGILVPPYVWPTGGAWDALPAVGRQFAPGRMIVIANNRNGPGYLPGGYVPAEADWVEAIAALRRVCVSVVGYVHDCYANRKGDSETCPRSKYTPKTMFDDIDRWFSTYRINGIFIDEVACDDATDPERAQSFVNAVRGHRSSALVVLNPGKVPPEEFMTATDPALVVVQEGEFALYQGTDWPPDGWLKDRRTTRRPAIPARRLCIIAHTPTGADDIERLLDVAERYKIGFVYGQHTNGPSYAQVSRYLETIRERICFRNRLPPGAILCRGTLMAPICRATQLFEQMRPRSANSAVPSTDRRR